MKKNHPCSPDLRSSEDPGPCHDSEEPGVEDRIARRNGARHTAPHTFDANLIAHTNKAVRSDLALTIGRDARFRGLETEQIKETASTT